MGNPLYDRLLGIHAGKDTPFLHLPDGQTLTHATFLDTAARLANTMTGLEMEPGDRVAVQVEKSVEALALYAACVQAGADLSTSQYGLYDARAKLFHRKQRSLTGGVR